VIDGDELSKAYAVCLFDLQEVEAELSVVIDALRNEFASPALDWDKIASLFERCTKWNARQLLLLEIKTCFEQAKIEEYSIPFIKSNNRLSFILIA